MKNKKKKILFSFLAVLVTGAAVLVASQWRNRPTDENQPKFAEPGKEIGLADFLDSREAAAVTQIDYWVETEKHRLTASPESSRAFLDILRGSGYEKVDISQSEELRSMFWSDGFQVFEILSGGKKYFLGVSRSEPGCLAFGGNHYTVGREIRTELMHAGKPADGSTDSAAGEKTGGGVSTLSDFFADGGKDEIKKIVCWSWGNLYELTDDPQTVRWFVENLDPERLQEADRQIEGGHPELSLAMVSKDKKYIFHVNKSYISMGDEPLADDGSVYRKIQEISNWELES